MNTTSVSAHDFVELFPQFSKSVSNFFNRKGSILIVGNAQILTEGFKVHYTHNLSNGLLTIRFNGYVLHQQIAYNRREVLVAFKTAEDNFFTADFRNITPEDVSFLETDKGKRCKKYSTSKKSIKNDDRGQKERRKERRARKTGTKYPDNSYRGIFPDYTTINNNNRFKGRSLSGFNTYEIEFDNFHEFSTPAPNIANTREDANYCPGMNVLIEKDGIVGAVSFNPNYFGLRIIRAA